MKKYIFLFIAIGLLLSAACEKAEKIDDFPLVKPTLVINSHFNDIDPITVHVSRSLSVLDNAELKDINDARVELYKDGSLIETLTASADGEGNYEFIEIADIGAEYQVKAYHSKYDDISSEIEILPAAFTFTPGVIKILDSTSWYDSWDSVTNIDFSAQMSFTVHDVAGEENYYAFRVIEVDSIKDWQSGQLIEVERPMSSLTSTDPAIDAGMTEVFGSDENSLILFTDELFDGKDYTMSFDFSGYTSDKARFYLKVYSLSRASYLYEKSNLLYDNAMNNPFAEPVQIYNNIENGFGIFAGFHFNEQQFSIF